MMTNSLASRNRGCRRAATGALLLGLCWIAQNAWGQIIVKAPVAEAAVGTSATLAAFDAIREKLRAGIVAAYAAQGIDESTMMRIGSMNIPQSEPLFRKNQAARLAIRAEFDKAVRAWVALGVESVPFILDLDDNLVWKFGSYAQAQAIAKIGAPAAPYLIARLSGSDRLQRFRAAQWMSNIKDERAADALLKALSDPEPGLGQCAAVSLGAMRERRAVEPLIAIWEEDSWRIVPRVPRLNIVQALGQIGDPRGAPPLRKSLETTLENAERTHDWAGLSEQFQALVLALGQMRDEPSVPMIKRLLDAPSQAPLPWPYAINQAAADALTPFGYGTAGDSQTGGYRITAQPGSAATPAMQARRDYEAARTEPQPLALWLTVNHGCGGDERLNAALERDISCSYPLKLVWPEIKEGKRYTVEIRGVHGSRPAQRFECAARTLTLTEEQLKPGRYQWSVSVYDGSGKHLGDIDPIEPASVFATREPRPPRNGQVAMLDLSHSANSTKGLGYYNHEQFMIKDMLEATGFEVRVNQADLLTRERLQGVDLVVMVYYWAGWPAFHPFTDSELAAIEEYVRGGGKLLLSGCDRRDGGGQMTAAGNPLAKRFGLSFVECTEKSEVAAAMPVKESGAISFDQPIHLQLAVAVEGTDGKRLLECGGQTLAVEKSVGEGRVIVAGAGMSFLDCYLANFEAPEGVHRLLFLDCVRELTGIDWRKTSLPEFQKSIEGRR